MKKKILVVDDEEDIRELIAASLGADDRYDVLFAHDGQQALEIARCEKPDLLLLDVLMPFVNGYEVCRRLKEDPATRDIKVVMLTALAQLQDEWKGREVGADDYFTKPFSPTALLNRVHELLGLP